MSIRILFSFLVLISFFLFVKIFDTYAATVTTSVTVGNAAPAFTAGPAENPASTTTTPTDVGTNVTFTATANDNSGESYYLIVCSTNAADATESGEPTCTATEYCTSTLTTDEVATSCTYGVTAGDTLESYAWYAFVCDANSTNAKCSAGSQGTGDSGSPFAVNHPPSFTLAGITDSTVDPGTDPEWTTTASDADTGGTADTVKLLVCKTTGISAGACDGGAGDTWCSSSLVASNPTCTYDLASVAPDLTDQAAYVYVVDSHNLAAGGDYQADDIPWTINNITPVVSSVTINGGAAIDLTTDTTKNVVLTATVTDNNSCAGGEIATVLGYAYRSSVGTAGCDAAGELDYDSCYPEVSCSVGGADTCDGTSDASASYTCTAAIYYYADPTDVATQYPDDTWLDTIKATDDDTASHSLEVSTGVEMNSLTAASFPGTLSYSSVEVGQIIDPLSIEYTTTNKGNVGLDQEYSAYNNIANMCTDYPTCSGGTIAVSYEHYALTGAAYSSGWPLSITATERELNVLKPYYATSTFYPQTKITYWGIEIPTGTTQGEYSGSNTFTAIKGETANW